ncbi:MAG: beta-lactamase family protein [Actinomycetota bacterium]|nr:beta-lactamase family protein [Actinomycetota bacterium]
MAITSATKPDLARVVELLERQRADEWQDGAQCYVSRNGEVLLDVTVGESRPGRALEPDDVMLLYSAGKPLTVVAILQLWERGKLRLDDRIGDFVAGWGAGKERCTIRHVLTHTGGFPNADAKLFDRDVAYADVVAHIAASPARWEPGTDAAYHPSSGWKVLGAVVERVDGRPIDLYLRDEVLAPLGLDNMHLGIPLEEQSALGERIVPVSWRGHVMPSIDEDGGLKMVPYKVDEYHNEPYFVAKVEPGGGTRGSARGLGRFYESLLGFGPSVLEPRTVETMSAVHRYGIKDRLFRRNIPWGLGVQVAFTGGTGRRAFGHGGMASSRALADPEFGLVMAIVSNGLPSFLPAEQRLFQVTDAVYSALGEDVARTRQAAVPVEELFGLST